MPKKEKNTAETIALDRPVGEAVVAGESAIHADDVTIEKYANLAIEILKQCDRSISELYEDNIINLAHTVKPLVLNLPEKQKEAIRNKIEDFAHSEKYSFNLMCGLIKELGLFDRRDIKNEKTVTKEIERGVLSLLAALKACGEKGIDPGSKEMNEAMSEHYTWFVNNMVHPENSSFLFEITDNLLKRKVITKKNRDALIELSFDVSFAVLRNYKPNRRLNWDHDELFSPVEEENAKYTENSSSNHDPLAPIKRMANEFERNQGLPIGSLEREEVLTIGMLYGIVRTAFPLDPRHSDKLAQEQIDRRNRLLKEITGNEQKYRMANFLAKKLAEEGALDSMAWKIFKLDFDKNKATKKTTEESKQTPLAEITQLDNLANAYGKYKNHEEDAIDDESRLIIENIAELIFKSFPVQRIQSEYIQAASLNSRPKLTDEIKGNLKKYEIAIFLGDKLSKEHQIDTIKWGHFKKELDSTNFLDSSTNSVNVEGQPLTESGVMDDENTKLVIDFADATDPVEIGLAVKTARKTAGLSQNQLVAKTNNAVSKSTLSTLESGKAKHVPQLSTLSAIGEAVGMTVKLRFEK